MFDRSRIFVAILLTGPSVMVSAGCHQQTPEATLAEGDLVQFVTANRGHEIVVKKGKRTARVRLVGVYAFDPRVRRGNDLTRLADQTQAWWNERFKDQELEIRLELKTTDPRGRYLGYLHHQGADIAEGLLRQGHLATYTEYPFSRQNQYFSAEGVARDKKAGIWASKTAADRLRALRTTWASAHARRAGKKPQDPLLIPEPNP